MQSDGDHFRELSDLAIDRVEKAIMSVGQLMDSEAQLYSLFVAVAAGIAQNAARQIHGAMERREAAKGKVMPPHAFKSAQVHVMSQILEALGIDHLTSHEKHHEI